MSTEELYFKNTRQIRKKTLEEEQLLIKQASAGFPKARQELISTYSTLAIHMAKKFVKHIDHNLLELSDLISEANLAVIEAIDKNKTEHPQQLTAFMKKIIHFRLVSLTGVNASIIYIPKNLYSTGNKRCYTTSLNTPLGNEEDSETLEDILPDNETPSIIQILLENSKNHQIQTIFDQLTPQEREILGYFYGIDNKTILETRQIVTVFNVHLSTIWIYKRKAINHLKQIINNNKYLLDSLDIHLP